MKLPEGVKIRRNNQTYKNEIPDDLVTEAGKKLISEHEKRIVKENVARKQNAIEAEKRNADRAAKKKADKKLIADAANGGNVKTAPAEKSSLKNEVSPVNKK